MKRISIIFGFLFILLLCFTPLRVSSQDARSNYVLTAIARSGFSGDYSLSNSLVGVSYFNGLGWKVQRSSVGITPSGLDLVDYTEYDPSGRNSMEWLSVPYSGSGSYLGKDAFKSSCISYYGDTSPYSLTDYESCSLDRVLKVVGPGDWWHRSGKGVSHDYLTDEISGHPRVKRFVVTNSLHTVQFSSYHNFNNLFVEHCSDEDGRGFFRYVDKSGNVVLLRYPCPDGSFSDTYYAYDLYGRLRFILPPLAVDGLVGGTNTLVSGNSLDLYAYVYDYDGYGNVSYFKPPGCAPVYYLYDSCNRCVLSQDGNQRGSGIWKASSYDVRGRLAYAALVRDTRTQFELTNISYNSSCRERYTGNPAGYGYTTGLLDLLGRPYTMVNTFYYDDYQYQNLSGFPSELHYLNYVDYGRRMSTSQTFLTGEMSFEPESDAARFTSRYYDNKGREIQTVGQNVLGGTDRHVYKYSFTGNVVSHFHVHTAPGKENLAETYSYTYDHGERLFSVTHSLNNSPPEELERNVYDEVGRLRYQHVNGYRHSYQYNIRNWLTSLDSPFLKEHLGYDFYNGNLSGLSWLTCNESLRRIYQFEYDCRNFLSGASYSESNGLTSTTQKQYDVSISEYDKQGNILSLRRNGLIYYGFNPPGVLGGFTVSGGIGGALTRRYGSVDNLHFSYRGNQLLNVSGSGFDALEKDAMHFVNGSSSETEYTYDGNGNLTSDLNKGIGRISYNDLNQPIEVMFNWVSSDGSNLASLRSRNYLRHRYDSHGRKLASLYMTDSQAGVGTGGLPIIYSYINSTVEYCDNIVYENGELSRILLGNGFVTRSSGRFVYHFYEKDHQGNIRLVYNANQEVEQVNHYYPFGGLLGDGVGGALQPEKYSGKELDRMYGLDLYDFHARQYDPVLCRFTSVDPMAVKYHWLSPYAYCMNNPVGLVDPTGKDIYRYDFSTGQFTLAVENDDEFDQVGKFRLNEDTGMYDLLTNRRGVAKTLIDGIEKGILHDGLNFMNSDYVLSVGGPGQASVGGFERFITKFSDLVRREMNGYYLAKNGSESISFIGMTHYNRNTYSSANGVFMLPRARPDLYGQVYQHTDYHTHPSDAMEVDAGNRSDRDYDRKVGMLEKHPEVKRFILLINGHKTKEY